MKFMILVLIVFGTLALFNPDQRDFALFAEERAQTIVSDRVRESSDFLGQMGASIMGTLAREVAAGAVERQNYIVCSVYTLDLNGRHNPGGEWVFLGVAKQFFELERPAMLGG